VGGMANCGGCFPKRSPAKIAATVCVAMDLSGMTAIGYRGLRFKLRVPVVLAHRTAGE
jgi:hypothetical protein